MPCVLDLLLLFVLLLVVLRLFLSVFIRIDKDDVALGRAVLQVGGEFRAVGEFYVLLPYQASIFEYADGPHVEVDVGDLLLDINLINRQCLNLVCEFVDAHKAFDLFPGLGVGKLDRLTEVAGLVEFRLVLLCE